MRSHAENALPEAAFSRAAKVRVENESSRWDLRFRKMETRTPERDSQRVSHRARKRGLASTAWFNAHTQTRDATRHLRRSYYTMSLFGSAWAPREAAADRNAKHRARPAHFRAVACRKWSRALNTLQQAAAFVRNTRRAAILKTGNGTNYARDSISCTVYRVT